MTDDAIGGELRVIREWGSEATKNHRDVDWLEYMDLIKSMWIGTEWGWHEYVGVDGIIGYPTRKYYISTSGWARNKAIVRSMEHNQAFWTVCWRQSMYDGCHVFEVRELTENE
jgi:hypothetical protein